jgi:hypothetical protein
MIIGTIHPADELGHLQHGSIERVIRERELASILIADREARVGKEFGPSSASARP